MKNLLINIIAWIVVIATSFMSLVLIAGIFVLSTYFKSANLTKLLLVDCGILFLAFLIFITGLGFFELIRKEEKSQEEIVELKEEVEKIERQN